MIGHNLKYFLLFYIREVELESSSYSLIQFTTCGFEFMTDLGRI